MKQFKFLLLALLFSQVAVAQQLDPRQIPPLPATNTTVDNSLFDVLTGTNSQTLWEQNDTALLNARTTCIREGGVATLNGTAAVDITAGGGQILSSADPNNVGYTAISWTAKTNVSPVGGDGLSYWFVDDNTDAIKQTTSAPTPQNRRDRIYLIITSTTGGNITGYASIVDPCFQLGQTTGDLARGLGIFKTSGLGIISGGADNTIAHTAGEVFDLGANWTVNQSSPNFPQFNAFDTGTGDFARYTTSTTLSTTDITDYDFENYQVNGVITAIPGNFVQDRFGIHLVFVFPGGNVRIAYGDEFFFNIDDAIASLSTLDPLSLTVNGFENGILLGAVVAEKDITDLDDAIANGDAVIVNTSPFGGFGAGVGSGGGTDDQTAAEVTTDTTNFDGNLDNTATTMQLVADAFDDFVAGGGGSDFTSDKVDGAGVDAFSFTAENDFSVGNVVSFSDNLGDEKFNVSGSGYGNFFGRVYPSILSNSSLNGYMFSGSGGYLTLSGAGFTFSTGNNIAFDLGFASGGFSHNRNFAGKSSSASGMSVANQTFDAGFAPLDLRFVAQSVWADATTFPDGANILLSGGEGATAGNRGNVYIKSSDALVSDADLSESQLVVFIDESNNKLIFKAKYSDGTTVKVFEIDANP